MRAVGTYFASLFARDGRRFEASWPRFFDRLTSARTFDTKEAAPRWSPATFTGNRRALAHVERVSAVVLDVDSGADVEAIDRAFGDFYGLAHTTWSSTAESPRWRVVVPLDRRVSAPDFARVWRFVASQAERAGVVPDYAARDASRIWSVPAIPHGAVYVARELRGAIVSVDDALAEIPKEAPIEVPPPGQASVDLGRRIERARRWLACVDGAIAGSGGHRATFRAALGLVRGFDLPEEDALRLLADDYNPRCAPPWSIRELRHKVRSAATRARVAPGWLVNATRRSA